MEMPVTTMEWSFEVKRADAVQKKTRDEFSQIKCTILLNENKSLSGWFFTPKTYKRSYSHHLWPTKWIVTETSCIHLILFRIGVKKSPRSLILFANRTRSLPFSCQMSFRAWRYANFHTCITCISVWGLNFTDFLLCDGTFVWIRMESFFFWPFWIFCGIFGCKRDFDVQKQMKYWKIPPSKHSIVKLSFLSILSVGAIYA